MKPEDLLSHPAMLSLELRKGLLPDRLLVAFAARCAERVRPLFEDPERTEAPERDGPVLDAAIAFARLVATSGRSLEGRARSLEGRVRQAYLSSVSTPAFVACAARYALVASRELPRGGEFVRDSVMRAASHAANAVETATCDPEIHRAHGEAMREDYDWLRGRLHGGDLGRLMRTFFARPPWPGGPPEFGIP